MKFNYRKFSFPITCLILIGVFLGCSSPKKQTPKHLSLSEQNLLRSIQLADSAFAAYFEGEEMKMARFYNPLTNSRSEEVGSIWMYTSAMEAVDAIMHGLKLQHEHGNDSLYKEHFARFENILEKLYTNGDYYLGTFELTSYTQTNEWTVYGVNRGGAKGTAEVAGVMNVYDDQMWLARELIEAYHLTGKKKFLEKAEYLTEYVLDGWDCTFDESGNENGGITWGPGYVTKHSCSNGPMVSPLVWLSEIYDGAQDSITYRYIDDSDRQTRISKSMSKSDYYLMFAKKVYNYQKDHLLRQDNVYADMMGGCTPGKPELEQVDGVTYRKGITCTDPVGAAISYNSGTMLSGGIDLLRVTKDQIYLEDVKVLSDSSFEYFTELDKDVTGYYSYEITGFNGWFNGVLMRGYTDVYSENKRTGYYLDTFQQNLDYAYDHYLKKGILPTNLLAGWNSDDQANNTEGMFSFARAAEYAVLSKYELDKE
ncbi:glycoside hydrolase family 76 protein [Marinoscillum pacificum]|uniref:glycoside hydrolase family 76 protein n=1 Tax=Marinoscillum pacificum TaxID=392723 RepID=UPI00215818A6|nr:glycoside hydrolase family 76 protein [Marinoscillum pacificum]